MAINVARMARPINSRRTLRQQRSQWMNTKRQTEMDAPKTPKRSDSRISGDFFGALSVVSNAIPIAKAIEVNDASQIKSIRGTRQPFYLAGIIHLNCLGDGNRI